MAYAAGEDEEMEDGVDKGAVVGDGIDDGSRDVEDAFGYQPVDGDEIHALQQGTEGHEHGEAHEDEADGLEVAVVFQPTEAGEGAGQGGAPHEEEETPSPPAGIAQGHEGDGGIGTGDVPVDGGVVPATEHGARRPGLRQGVVEGAGDVAADHADQIEDDACGGPPVGGTDTPKEEEHADDDSKDDADGMGADIPAFFFFRVADHKLKLQISYRHEAVER